MPITAFTSTTDSQGPTKEDFFAALKTIGDGLHDALETVVEVIEEIVSFFKAFVFASDRNNRVLVNEAISRTLDIAILPNGEFAYKDRRLGHIHQKSKHGRLLALLLQSPDHYISDAEAIKLLDVADEAKGLGYIVRDLKDGLRQDGIDVQLRRNHLTGRSLVSLSPVAS